MQVQILHAEQKGLRVPTRMKSLKIDPMQHLQYAESGIIGICYYNMMQFYHGGFRSLVSCKGADLSHICFLFTINKKAYTRIGSPSMTLYLILMTWRGQCQGHSDLERLDLIKGLS